MVINISHSKVSFQTNITLIVLLLKHIKRLHSSTYRRYYFKMIYCFVRRLPISEDFRSHSVLFTI